jgi:hypothetical protein
MADGGSDGDATTSMQVSITSSTSAQFLFADPPETYAAVLAI